MNADIEPHWQRSALLTIDMQRDFLSDGAFAVAGTSEILPAMRRLVGAFRESGRPVVHVVRLYLADGSNADLSRRAQLRAGAAIVRPGSAGAELAADLATGPAGLDSEVLLRGELQRVDEGEFIVFKPRWNAFFETPLDAWLRSAGVDTVVVAGCNFPNCPRATLFGASERDYRAVAVADALSGWTDGAPRELEAIGVRVASTNDVMDALLRAGQA